MKINFSKDSKLTISQTKKINEIEPLVREEYENYIGLLAEKFPMIKKVPKIIHKFLFYNQEIL